MTEPASAGRSALDRLLAAYPLIVAYLILLILYAWQTTKHSTPWLFTDELDWALRSRGVAHHGVEYLRFQRAGFSSLYAYLIAPGWWSHSTQTGYEVAKYLNAVAMAASLFPGYLLARLFVPRWPAVACGVATAAIPALAYTGVLIPENLAYPWATLVLWLGARALLRPTRKTVAAAVVALVIAPAVRNELAFMIPGALLAAIVFLGTGERMRRTIGSWSWRERVGAALLVVGALVWMGALGNHHSYTWQIGGHYWHRMFTYGLWAIGAFTIGVGVIPVVLGLAWTLDNRFRELEDRALGSVLIGAVVAFGLYTAVKASYISTNFAIRVEERNFIYVAPVAFAAAARWATTGRTRPLPALLAVAATGWLLWSTPYHNEEHFYSDAPGLSVLQWLNQKDYWTTSDARHLLFGILAGSALLLLAGWTIARRRPPAAALVAGGTVLAVLVVGWNLWGEAAAATASNSFSKTIVALPSPPNWVDNETDRKRTMVIGQSLSGSNHFWSLEFWNQSIQYVWSVDASAPGPGPTRTPNFLDTTGAVDPQITTPYVLAAPGVTPVGRLLETTDNLRLYRVGRPVRLLDAYGGLTNDGSNWMSTSSWYYHFAPNGPRPGTLTVTLSRAAACGDVPASHITLRLSSLQIAKPKTNGQPIPKKLLAVRHVLLRSTPCDTTPVRFHVTTPFRVDVTSNRTFPSSDGEISAQVTYDFKPS